VSDLRTLTVRQPWADAFFFPDNPKDVENRTWGTDYRGDVAIIAARTVDTAALADVTVPDGHGLMATSGVIGVVTLTDIHEYGDTTCAETPYLQHGRWSLAEARSGRPVRHWMLTNPRKFTVPLSGTGHLGLRTPDRTLAADIHAALAALSKEQNA